MVERSFQRVRERLMGSDAGIRDGIGEAGVGSAGGRETSEEVGERLGIDPNELHQVQRELVGDELVVGKTVGGR
jgi:hypothetical protein